MELFKAKRILERSLRLVNCENYFFVLGSVSFQERVGQIYKGEPLLSGAQPLYLFAVFGKWALYKELIDDYANEVV
ncbi:hypothetical protein D3C78_899280 [compost metagenome]